MKSVANNRGKILIAGFLFLFLILPVEFSAQSGRRTSEVPPNPALQSVSSEVKYEGGMFGRNKANKGKLVFDGANEQIVFEDKNGNKLFSVPYSSVIAAYAAVRRKNPYYAGWIANGVPYGGGLHALLIKTTARFLVIHYKEADTDLQGIGTFTFEEKLEIAPRLETLVRDSGSTARENIYVRVKTPVGTQITK